MTIVQQRENRQDADRWKRDDARLTAKDEGKPETPAKPKAEESPPPPLTGRHKGELNGKLRISEWN